GGSNFNHKMVLAFQALLYPVGAGRPSEGRRRGAAHRIWGGGRGRRAASWNCVLRTPGALQAAPTAPLSARLGPGACRFSDSRPPERFIPPAGGGSLIGGQL